MHSATRPAAAATVPPGSGCDAILTIGSSFLSTKLLGNLQVAVQRYKAVLPPVVQYLVGVALTPALNVPYARV